MKRQRQRLRTFFFLSSSSQRSFCSVKQTHSNGRKKGKAKNIQSLVISIRKMTNKDARYDWMPMLC
jgi:hypothetical protein